MWTKQYYWLHHSMCPERYHLECYIAYFNAWIESGNTTGLEDNVACVYLYY